MSQNSQNIQNNCKAKGSSLTSGFPNGSQASPVDKPVGEST